MAFIQSGVDLEGKPLTIFVENKLVPALDIAKKRVLSHNWDYVAITAGLPGSGKSTFDRTPARYCCPWFNHRYIAFTDKQFIRITNQCKEFSSVVLDESFASLNTKVGMSPEFLRIINHLQLIRQRHLFIFLTLPNFFDLSKGVAIFRSSHLFVVYADDEGRRGKFAAFGRDEKRELYVRGSKFMDYNSVKANFIGRFTINKGIVDEQIYENMKLEHLKSQANLVRSVRSDRNSMIYKLYKDKGWKVKDIVSLTGLEAPTIHEIIREYPINQWNYGGKYT